jgi:hypothetical protein
MFISRSRYNQLLARVEMYREAADDARKVQRAALTTNARIAEQVVDTTGLRDRLAKSEQGRRNLMGLLEHHRDMGALGLLRKSGDRLDRALRACARYRADNARLTRQVATLQGRLDNAVGLDAPSLDLGAKWQERRTDKPWPKFEELD